MNIDITQSPILIIKWFLGIMFIYGILLILFSIYLFIRKKGGAKKKLLQGVLFVVIPIVINIILVFSICCL